MYGKFIEGVLYVVNSPRFGYKPFVYTEAPEAPSGYHAGYIWSETIESILQVWEIVEDFDDVDEEADYADAGRILLGEEVE